MNKNEEISIDLLNYLYETEKIKKVIRNAYIHGDGTDYKDIAIVISEENYIKIREWLDKMPQ